MKRIAVFGAIAFCTLFVLSFSGRVMADGSNDIPMPPVGGGGDDGSTMPGYPGTGYGDMSNFQMSGIFDGKFEYTNGHVNGDYVEFDVNESTGAISNFEVKTMIIEWPEINYTDIKDSNSGDANGTIPPPPPGPEPPNPPQPEPPIITYSNITIFDSVKADRFVSLQTPTVVGGMFLFQAEEILIIAYDAPFANLFYATTSGATGNNTVTFDVADGLNITMNPWDGWSNGIRDSSGSKVIGDNDTNPPSPVPPPLLNFAWIDGKDISGSLFVENGILNVTGDKITVVLEKSGYTDFYAFSIMPGFMEILGPDVKEETKNDMRDAIASGQVGAEINIGKDTQISGGTPSSGDMTYNTVRYDSTLELRPLDYNNERVQVEVSSTNPTSRLIMVNIQKDVMSVDDTSKLTVKMDGEPIQKVTSTNSVLSEKGTNAMACIVSGTGGVSLIIYVPHFSVHTITVEIAGLINSGTMLVPIIAGIAVTVVAFGLIARRRKSR